MHDIYFEPDGGVACVYSDEVAPVLRGLGLETRRASFVEPSGDGWTADLSPVSGPVLGPFTARQAALDAEREWLDAAMARGRVEVRR